MAGLFFYLLSAVAVASAIGVVAAKNPLMSVMSLLGTFVCLAGIYLVAGFQFIAAAQLIVYAGAILVLFLFVVMLLNLGDVRELAEHPTRTFGANKLALVGFAVGGLALVGIVAAGQAPVAAADPTLAETGYDSISGIAGMLFGRYAMAFQSAGILLLATMVAVIVLAKRQRSEPASNPKLGAAGDTEFSIGDPQP